MTMDNGVVSPGANASAAIYMHIMDMNLHWGLDGMTNITKNIVTITTYTEGFECFIELIQSF